ncbi:MAG: DMT family transporter [Rhodothermales bacterium]
MRMDLFIGTLLLGIVLAVHLGMNGRVGSIMDNARVANALFWTIGAVTAIIVGISGWEAGVLDNIRDINPLLFTAGALGAVLVFTIAWMIPRMGAGPVFILLLTGQVLGSLVMSHFGWLGSPEEPISLVQIIGAAVMIAGASIATLTG